LFPKKIKSKVTLGRITITFPKSIVLQGLYVEDLHKDTLLNIHLLKLDVNLIDLFSKKVVLNVIDVENLKSHIRRPVHDSLFNYSFILDAFSSGKHADSLKTSSNTLPAWGFSVTTIKLKDIHLIYADGQSGINAGLQLGTFKCVLDGFGMKKTQTNPADQKSDSSWFLNITNLDVANTSIDYENLNNAVLEEGLDPNHLSLSDFQIHCRDVFVSPHKGSFNLLQMQVQEKCGLHLTQVNARFNFDSTHLSLDQFELQTEKSKIAFSLSVKYNALSTLLDSISRLYLQANIKNSTIAFSDIVLIHPALLQQNLFEKNQNTLVHIQTTLEGTETKLRIQNLELSAGLSTVLKLKGEFLCLGDSKKMFADIHLIDFKTGKKDLEILLPSGMLPASISLPEFLQMNGQVKGNVQVFDIGVELHSTIGELKINAKTNLKTGNEEQSYSANMSMINLDVGELIHHSDHIGPISLVADVKGKGLSTNYFQAELNVNILKAALNGRILSGLLSADLSKEKNKNIIGNLSFLNGMIVSNNTNYVLDSILLSSDYKDSLAELVLQSGPVSAEMKGTFNLELIPQVVAQQLKTYFDLSPDKIQEQATVQKQEKAAVQNFGFNLRLRNPGKLAELFAPQLQQLLPSEIKGNYNSFTKKSGLEITVPQLIYAGTELDSLKLSVNTSTEALGYSLKVAAVSSAQLRIENINSGGVVANNEASFQLNALKEDSTKKGDSTLLISIGGVLKQPRGELQLHLNPDLVLNQVNWKIDSSNYIGYGKQGLLVHQFVLSQGNESVSVNSANQQSNSLNSAHQQSAQELQVKFNHFSLTDISRIIEHKDSLIKGIVDGTFALRKQGNATGFISDMTVKDLVYQGAAIGEMTLHADNLGSADKYNLKLNVTGNQNDLTMSGYYLTGVNENNLHLLLDIQNLNLGSAEPFTFHEVSDLSGSMNGKLTVSGTAGAPDISGKLNFIKAGMKPGIIASYLKIDNASIVLESKKIKFNSFELRDSLNNTAALNGYVDLQNFTNIRYDLHLKTTDFLALNTTQKDNPTYYGKILLSSDISLKGDVAHPVLNIKAKLNKGSSLIYVRPNDNQAEVESKGIVEFTDTLALRGSAGNSGGTGKASAKSDSVTAMGIDVTATIEVDKNTKLKILIDPVSGDSVVVRGDANLNFSLDRNGTTSLTGSYTVSEGSYHLSLNEFLKKNFKIDAASKIIWSGDLMDAYLDLSAVYHVKAAPLGLLEGQMTGMSDAQKNMYMTNLDFLVYVKIKGDMDKPEISFDIQQPSDQREALNGAVDNQLNQIRPDANEMGKQVFALLSIGSFIATDPLSSSGGSGNGVSSAALSGAGSLLSQPLNAFTAKYVKGVDVNLGVNSFDDYSGGQMESRTQVNMGLSKKLFKDKVTVQVGGNVDVEGAKAKENNASELAGNVLIEYRLTADSRYKLKMFQKTDYENPIEGELTETGVGIVFTRDFNKVKELFLQLVKR